MYNLSWIVDNRVILLRNEGKLNGRDLQQLSRDLETMMADAVAPLHIIEDDRELNKISNIDISTIRDTVKAIDFSKLSYTLAIVPEELEEVTDLLGNFWELITDVDYERVKSVPEAIEFLAQHDATLPERSEWQLELA